MFKRPETRIASRSSQCRNQDVNNAVLGIGGTVSSASLKSVFREHESLNHLEVIEISLLSRFWNSPCVSDTGCECCKLDFRIKLIAPQQIMPAPVTDDIKLSLKVYAEAYFFAMQELTGGVDSEFSIRVLNECRIDIAKGHWMELR